MKFTVDKSGDLGDQATSQTAYLTSGQLLMHKYFHGSMIAGW